MSTDAAPVALPEPVALPDLAEAVLPSLPPIAVTADPTGPSLPLTPLAAVEVSPVPGVGRLIGLARTALGVLAHPYPRRAPRPPLTREEHLALADNERARLEREREAYRRMALGGSIR